MTPIHYAAAAAGAAALIIIAALGLQVRALQSSLDTCREERAAWKASSDVQAAQVAGITERAAAVEAIAKQATAAALRHQTRATQILQLPPSDPSDACASADALATTYIQERATNAPPPL